MMRCKFKLNEVKDATSQATGAGVTVQFGAVYEPDDKKRTDPANENSIFGKFTPHGSFVATIYNPHLVEQLPKMLGQEFYIDFSPAPKAVAA